EDNVWISSFDHLALKNVQEQASHYPIGLLFYYRMLRPWDYAKQSGLEVNSIHPNEVYVDEEFVTACHAAGYKVYPYTVNKKHDYDKMIAAGVDGVFSNNPDILVLLTRFINFILKSLTVLEKRCMLFEH